MKFMRMGPYTVDVAICIDSADWVRELRKRGPECAKQEFPGSLGCVTTFLHPDGARLLVVTFTEALRREPFLDRVSIVVHEATHVWQGVLEHISEGKPGHEVEACGIQWITKWLLEQLEAVGWMRR